MNSQVVRKLKKNKGAYRRPARLSTVLPSAAATGALGRRLISSQDAPHVWLLRGPLGAGKTTLVRGMLRSLGVRRAVTSPTFTLSKTYRLRGQSWDRVVHIDGYRVRDNSELAALEVEELVDSRHVLLLVEWPERLPGVVWGPHGVIVLRRSPAGRRVHVSLRRR